MPDTRPRPGMGVAGMYEESMASEMPCVDAMWTPTKPAPRNMPVKPAARVSVSCLQYLASQISFIPRGNMQGFTRVRTVSGVRV